MNVLNAKRVFLLIIISLLTAGFGLSAFNVYVSYKIYETKKWPYVSGNIVSYSVERHANDEPGNRAFEPIIEYEYLLNKKKYLSKKIVFGDIYFSSKKKANLYLHQYIQLEKLYVFYNPQDPNESILEPGRYIFLVEKLVIGLFFLVIGGISLFFYLKIDWKNFNILK